MPHRPPGGMWKNRLRQGCRPYMSGPRPGRQISRAEQRVRSTDLSECGDAPSARTTRRRVSAVIGRTLARAQTEPGQRGQGDENSLHDCSPRFQMRRSAPRQSVSDISAGAGHNPH